MARGPEPQVTHFFTHSGIISLQPSAPISTTSSYTWSGTNMALNQALVKLQSLSVDHLFELCRCGAGGFQAFALFIDGGVISSNQEHEAVQLRLGQRIGAFLLDQVLRSQHRNGCGKARCSPPWSRDVPAWPPTTHFASLAASG